MASDEMGIWLSRKGTKRDVKGREEHVLEIEPHNRIIKRTMRLVKVEAELGGLDLTTRELFSESTSAKNQMTEYGGFSPMQCVLGANEGWSGAHLEEGESKVVKVFENAFRHRFIAMKCVREAVCQERIRASARGHGRAPTQDQLSPGTKIEAYTDPKRKDLPGWKGEGVVFGNKGPGKIIYKWQGVPRQAPPHLLRLTTFVLYGNYEVDSRKDELQKMLTRLQHRAHQLPFGSTEMHATLYTTGAEEYLTLPARETNLEFLKLAEVYTLEAHGMAWVNGV